MRLDETRNIQKSFEPKETVTRVKTGGISPRRRSVHTFNLVNFYIGVVQAYIIYIFMLSSREPKRKSMLFYPKARDGPLFSKLLNLPTYRESRCM
jgi:hypothetical protein